MVSQTYPGTDPLKEYPPCVMLPCPPGQGRLSACPSKRRSGLFCDPPADAIRTRRLPVMPITTSDSIRPTVTTSTRRLKLSRIAGTAITVPCKQEETLL